MSKAGTRLAVTAATITALTAGAFTTASAAAPAPDRVYVSPTGSAGRPDRSCGTAAYSVIQAAIEAAPAHGAVVVCAGTYPGSITIDKSLTLQGEPGAVIDATGQPYGVGTTSSWVTIAGLTVENASDPTPGAPDDGIITAGFGSGGSPVTADHVTVVDDVTRNNVGSGIDINSTSYSVARDDNSSGNGVGINVSNDLGVAASHNLIADNVSNDNPGGCGIVLADHTSTGVYDNRVTGNVADDNGLGTPSAPNASAGSGIIMAGSGGGVYNNLVADNTFDGNGHAGVVVHAHAPGMNMSGNTVVRNRIGVNNARGDTSDPYTTGVYLGDASPLTITVAGNAITGDYYGIFTAGPVTVTGHQANRFRGVLHPSGSTPVYLAG